MMRRIPKDYIRYLGQLFSSYGNPVISKISINVNIRNQISFFELQWDMNMQLVRDQIYYNAFREYVHLVLKLCMFDVM